MHLLLPKGKQCNYVLLIAHRCNATHVNIIYIENVKIMMKFITLYIIISPYIV